MATKVLVPLLGEGVEEVTVTKWLKKEGDSVNELEPLLEVNTDKVDTEIPAPASGTVLKILAEEGVPAKVGAVLAFIGKPGERVPENLSRRWRVTINFMQSMRRLMKRYVRQEPLRLRLLERSSMAAIPATDVLALSGTRKDLARV